MTYLLILSAIGFPVPESVAALTLYPLSTLAAHATATPEIQSLFCWIASNVHCWTGLFKKKKEHLAEQAAGVWPASKPEKNRPQNANTAILRVGGLDFVSEES
jgi:hypothetical protein